MRLYFVRHGQSEANLLNEFSNRGHKHGLTEQGRQQARELARKLSAKRISKIYSSPLLRAVETAEIVARELAIPLEKTDALREYDCGYLEAKSDPVSWQEYTRVNDLWLKHRQFDERISDGESFNDIRRRFEPFILDLIEEHRDSPLSLALVGHGGTYRCMLPIILSNVDFDFVIDRGMDHATVVVAETSRQGLVCTKWGDHSPR